MNISCVNNNRVNLLEGQQPKPIQRESSSLLGRILKVAGFAWLLFGQAAASALTVPNTKPWQTVCLNDVPRFGELPKCSLLEAPHLGVIALYEEAVSGLLPDHSQVSTRFPERMANFMYSGVGIVGNGDSGCVLVEKHEFYKKCKKLTNTFKDYINAQPAEVRDKVYHVGFQEKGHLLENLAVTPPEQILLGMNPQKRTNFVQGMKLWEENFLQDPDFYGRTDQEIVKLIKQTHEILLKKLPNTNKLRPGKYREAVGIIYYDAQRGYDYDEQYEYLRDDLKVSKKELELFKKSSRELEAGRADYTMLSGETKAVWRKIAYFMGPAEEVPHEMLQFVKQWKEFAKHGVHPVALAAWVHCQFGKIHPFSDGNGRLARLMMNAVLVREGYRPVVISSDEEYMEAMRGEENSPGAFARYLADRVIPWNRQDTAHILI